MASAAPREVTATCTFGSDHTQTFAVPITGPVSEAVIQLKKQVMEAFRPIVGAAANAADERKLLLLNSQLPPPPRHRLRRATLPHHLRAPTHPSLQWISWRKTWAPTATPPCPAPNPRKNEKPLRNEGHFERRRRRLPKTIHLLSYTVCKLATSQSSSC